MTEQLDKLPSVGINRNKYVFEYSKSRSADMDYCIVHYFDMLVLA